MIPNAETQSSEMKMYGIIVNNFKNMNNYFMKWCASILFPSGLIKQIETNNYVSHLSPPHCIALLMYHHLFDTTE